MSLLVPVSGCTLPRGEEAEMGHMRLGVLPKSRKWNQLVDELRLGADVDEVAASAAGAAVHSFPTRRFPILDRKSVV